MLVYYPVIGLPVIAIAIKFIYYKGANKKPRLYSSNFLALLSSKLTNIF